MLTAVWKVPNVIWVCNRGAAKTFVAAVYLLLKCMLWRNVWAGCVSETYPQASLTFDKISFIYDNAPLLKRETKGEPKSSKIESNLYFLNGSWICAFPARRGERFNILFIDEYRDIRNPEEFRKTVNPYLNNKHSEIQNTLLIASTACYEGEPFDILVNQYKELEAKGSKEFAVCDFNLFVTQEGGRLDMKRVAQDQQIMLSDEFAMEYLNEFVSLREGWLKAPNIRTNEIEFKPLITNEKGYWQQIGDPYKEYFLGADIARSEGGDNSAFCLIEINPDCMRVVKSLAMNGIPFDQQAMILRQLCRDFNVICLPCDFDQGGKAIRDILIKDMVDPRDGAYLPPIVPEDDYETSGALRIIRNVKFAQKDLIWKLGVNTKKALQNGKIKFPIDDFRIIVSEEEELSFSEDVRLELDIAREMQMLKKELTTVKVRSNDSNTSYTFFVDTPKRQKKDRFTAFILSCGYASEYFDEINGTGREEFVGVWG